MSNKQSTCQTETIVDGGGLRYNSGKPPMEYIPLHLLEDTAKVLHYVTTRPKDSYPPWNWARGMDWLKPYACLIRHISAWFCGQDIDADTGLPHLAHAMCNLLFLTHYSKEFPQGDNRPRGFFGKPLSSWLSDPVTFHNGAHAAVDATFAERWDQADDGDVVACQSPEPPRFEHEEIIRGHVIQIVREGEGFIDGERWTGRALTAQLEMLRAGYDTPDEFIEAIKTKTTATSGQDSVSGWHRSIHE